MVATTGEAEFMAHDNIVVVVVTVVVAVFSLVCILMLLSC